jgi:hypothetical protein
VTTSAESIGALEFERKFLIPRSRAAAARDCLGAYCSIHERNAESIVSSIYFDTPTLRLLGEKVDSDLYKTKIRLRWYEDVQRGPVETSSFLEVKSRVGTRRAKWRRRIDLSATELNRISFTDPALFDVLGRLEHDPTVAPQGLEPVLVVRYLRHRFRHRVSGSRIALDQRIEMPRFNTRFLPAARPDALPVTVLEIKNASGTPPANLPFLPALKAQSTSFSKYHACFTAAASVRGLVA